jgi:hypothetical protein
VVDLGAPSDARVARLFVNLAARTAGRHADALLYTYVTCVTRAARAGPRMARLSRLMSGVRGGWGGGGGPGGLPSRGVGGVVLLASAGTVTCSMWRARRDCGHGEASERLCRAAESGDVPAIQDAIAAGADVNVHEGTRERTPLFRAVSGRHVAAIVALLRAGAHVDCSSLSGATPLIMAALGSNPAAVDALLVAGADVHRCENDHNTALHIACLYGRLDNARLLLDAGAKTDVCGNGGELPVQKVRGFHANCGGAVASRCPLPLPRQVAQVCKVGNEPNAAALRALIASTAPWSRRRPLAVACYADVWDWLW